MRGIATITTTGLLLICSVAPVASASSAKLGRYLSPGQRSMAVVRLSNAAASAKSRLSTSASGKTEMLKPTRPGRAYPAAHAPAVEIAQARLATAKYALNLGRAKEDGYSILTQKIAGMGWHFINPSVKGFDVRHPPILVYERHGGHWQLGALEWVFPTTPATPPLQGATYGSFPAACHYRDGTFTPEPSADVCPTKSPQSGAAFNFWHPALVTMHVWIWYPNPAGMYASMNPLVDAIG